MAATTLGISGDTSIQDTNLQLIMVGQLQKIVNQLTEINIILKEHINGMRAVKIKLLLIQEGVKLTITIDQVVYIGLFLLKRALKQFKLYLTKIQKNG